MNYKDYLKEIKDEIDAETDFDIGGLIAEVRIYAGIS